MGWTDSVSLHGFSTDAQFHAEQFKTRLVFLCADSFRFMWLCIILSISNGIVAKDPLPMFASFTLGPLIAATHSGFIKQVYTQTLLHVYATCMPIMRAIGLAAALAKSPHPEVLLPRLRILTVTSILTGTFTKLPFMHLLWSRAMVFGITTYSWLALNLKASKQKKFDIQGSFVLASLAMFHCWENERAQMLLYRTQHAESTAILGTVSHDLRTPIHAVGLIISNLLSMESNTLTLRDPQTRAALEQACNAQKRMAGLVEDLLLASTIYHTGAERITMREETFNIKDCMQGHMNFLRQRIAPSVQLILKMEQRVPLTVITDELRLSQMITNLLENAAKFTQSGTISMMCTVAKGADSAQKHGGPLTLKIAVKDTGIGIAEEDAINLRKFQLFNKIRGEQTEVLNAKGTGLGLSICHKLASKLGGEFDFASDGPNCGSTFWFTVEVRPAPLGAAPTSTDAVDVPLALPAAGPASPTLAPLVGWGGVSDPPALNSTRTLGSTFIERPLEGPVAHAPGAVVPAGFQLLLVEDDRIVLIATRMMLRGSGVQVTEAANGQEALKILNGGERKFDCIFMDCNMPVMDGLECARQIRLCEARDGGLRHTPIIAHTANGEAEHAEECARAGMDAVLSKPFTRAAMLGYIKQVSSASDAVPEPMANWKHRRKTQDPQTQDQDANGKRKPELVQSADSPHNTPRVLPPPNQSQPATQTA
jgi:signal transduction histidine kinase/CheY-like chemotaxis protein